MPLFKITLTFKETYKWKVTLLEIVLSFNQNKSQNFLLCVFSRRDGRRDILYGGCSVDAIQIQGTFQDRVEMIPTASHRPETESIL